MGTPIERFDCIVTADRAKGFSRVDPVGVKVYHKPTGIEVHCDKFKSPHRNVHECLKMIEAEVEEQS